MDAQQPLTPMDRERFDVVVFGGILGQMIILYKLEKSSDSRPSYTGNVPSDDRTAEVRVFNFNHRRHLGPIQVQKMTCEYLNI